MPPKKKAPIVVGTVSTRSTRRESIVNIEIIPKTNKQTKRKKKESKDDAPVDPVETKITSEAEPEDTQDISLDETSQKNSSTDISNILKDWSDDDNTQDCVVYSGKDTDQYNEDKKALINILEGSDDKSGYTETSPKEEIVEECQVTDDNFIIVYPEEQSQESSSSSANCIQNEYVSPVSGKVESSREIEDESRSVTSDECNVVIVEVENFGTNNNADSSETSDNNFEIVEKTIICNLDEIDIKSHGIESEQKDDCATLKTKHSKSNGPVFNNCHAKIENPLESRSKSDEQLLCHKLNESVQISDRKTSSENLHNEMGKISIDSEEKNHPIKENGLDIVVPTSFCANIQSSTKNTPKSTIDHELGNSEEYKVNHVNIEMQDASFNKEKNVELKSKSPLKNKKTSNTVTILNEFNKWNQQPKKKLYSIIYEEPPEDSGFESALKQRNEQSVLIQKTHQESPQKVNKIANSIFIKNIEKEIDKVANNFNKTLNANQNLDLIRAHIDTTIDEVIRNYSYRESDRLADLEVDTTIDEVIRNYSYKESDTQADFRREDPKEKTKKEPKKKKEGKLKGFMKNRDADKERRRSDRIKTIAPLKKKSRGIVKSKSETSLADLDNSDSNSAQNDSGISTPTIQVIKPDKLKQKAKSAENVQSSGTRQQVSSPELPKNNLKNDKTAEAEIKARLKTFLHLKDNQYKTDRQVCKEAKEMVCDCYLAEEDIQNNEFGCGDDCLNRLLMIECGEQCQVGSRCTNKKIQKNMFAPVEVFKTDKKGLGLRAAANIAYGEFILEYVGEVLDADEFDERAEVYSKDKNIHFYFMSLRADAVIDATMKGNISRFINHSCDPNAETQKWTVNGELRIGFFSTRTILAGEEITFDYHFQRYGKEAQKCYCEATNCRGWLGERPNESDDEEEEEEEEEEDEESPKEDQPAAEVVSVDAKAKISTLDVNNDVIEKMETDQTTLQPATRDDAKAMVDEPSVAPEVKETPKKIVKKKKKDILFEDFDQLNGDIEMLLTTGLKNQAQTLKLSRLMVRAKDLEQRKKLLRILRRSDMACRRLFLDYHGLRLMHGYMVDAQQSTGKATSILDVMQTKLELLQTLAVLPIQNKTMLIESKVLPAVETWSQNKDIVEDGVVEQKSVNIDTSDPRLKEKIDEIKFLARKLLEEWVNLKESFRIPKKQRIEQMKEHEKEANRKFMETSYAHEKDRSRKHDHRYRTWSRYKSERENHRKHSRHEEKERPSAEYLKMSKHERRKLFALQMEIKEEERRMKQREMWRQHEMNCMMIGADPRFTAPFDPSKGFQYIWNPTLGQWQALPMPTPQNTPTFSSPSTPGFGITPIHQPSSSHKFPSFPPPSVITPSQPFAALQPPTIPPPTLLGRMPSTSLPNTALPPPPVIHGTLHNIPLPGINQPPLPLLPSPAKEDDSSEVKFAGPIPPPAKLPPKWKCAKDKYGRPYYYHVKLRKSQWEPPPLPPESSDSYSSDSSSVSYSDSSSDYDSDEDDSKLLLQVRKQMEKATKLKFKSPVRVKKELVSASPSPEIKIEPYTEDLGDVKVKTEPEYSSIDERLREQFNLEGHKKSFKKKRREGLCQEVIIPARTEEDRRQYKEDAKRYKATKEKLKRQKEQLMLQVKKKIKLSSTMEDIIKKPKEKRPKNSVKSKIKGMKEYNDENSKKIKEVFRTNMATTVVGVLNAYRKPDCKDGRIVNTEDFKHLARKLTHFVMLKEMKHISKIEDLVCSDSVKSKAREYIRKYMSKFSGAYQKRHDEPDFKD